MSEDDLHGELDMVLFVLMVCTDCEKWVERWYWFFVCQFFLKSKVLWKEIVYLQKKGFLLMKLKE